MALDLKPIRTGADTESALAEIERLWGTKAGTLEGDRLDVLAALIDAYESEHHPVDPSDPIEAIKFRMDQQGLTRRDLEAILAHLRQLEILTSCFTLTFRAEKATWHYITLSECISELGADPPLILRRDDPCRASVAALGGREGPASVARVCRPARRRSDARNVTPTES